MSTVLGALFVAIGVVLIVCDRVASNYIKYMDAWVDDSFGPRPDDFS